MAGDTYNIIMRRVHARAVKGWDTLSEAEQAVIRDGIQCGHLVVADQAERLALSYDEARSRLILQDDTGVFYVLIAEDPSDTANWFPVGGSGGGSKVKWFGAGELIPRQTGGAGINGSESSTHRVNKDVLEFDPGTEQFAQVWWVIPDNWTSATFTATFYWTATSGSGSVVWKVCACCYGDGSTIDAARGTAQTVTDALNATTQFNISAATAAVTPAGTVAEGALTLFEFSRDATAGADNLGVNARLVGVLIDYNG